MNTDLTAGLSCDFAGAVLVTVDKIYNNSAIWVDHPSFPGVAMKTLVTPDVTGGALKSLLVRVAPGAALEKHIHADEWEMHEVIAGSGQATLSAGCAEYRRGVIAVIPQGTEHSVRAGEQGLIMLAKFFSV